MAFPQFVTDAIVLADVAGALRSWKSSPPIGGPNDQSWTQIVALQHLRATNEIYSVLIGHGWDAVTQIPLWDRGPEWERGLALLYSLEAGNLLLEVDPKLLQTLRDAYATTPGKLSGLDTLALTVGGVFQAPQNVVGTVQVGGGGNCRPIFHDDPRHIHV